MPRLEGAGDKPDIPPPHLSSTYLEISLLINHGYKVQVAEQGEKQLCETGNRVLCPHQRVTG